MLYKMLFVKPVLDTTMSGRVTDESRLLQPYSGKTIGEITIDRRQVFDPGGNWLERTANKTHRLTRERVIRRDLLFEPGDTLDPELIVRQQTADPLARLHRRHRHRGAARRLRLDARQPGHHHARQLDHLG